MKRPRRKFMKKPSKLWSVFGTAGIWFPKFGFWVILQFNLITRKVDSNCQDNVSLNMAYHLVTEEQSKLLHRL